MKKNKLHIIYSWLLLICFIAGQYMVYTHQHLFIKGVSKTAVSAVHDHQQHQTIKEKCYMCDVMHHQAVVFDTLSYFSPQVVTIHLFKAPVYNFVNIGLVLAAGRAPPAFS